MQNILFVLEIIFIMFLMSKRMHINFIVGYVVDDVSDVI